MLILLAFFVAGLWAVWRFLGPRAHPGNEASVVDTSPLFSAAQGRSQVPRPGDSERQPDDVASTRRPPVRFQTETGEPLAIGEIDAKQFIQNEINQAFEDSQAGRKNEAINHWRNLILLLELRETQRPQLLCAMCCVNMGSDLIDLGRYGEAIDGYNKALEKYKKYGGPENEVAMCLQNLGVIHNELGQYRDGMMKSEQALEMFKRLPGTERECACCLLTTGWSLQGLGQHEESFGRQLSALRMLENVRNSDTALDQVKCLMNIGNWYMGQCRYEDALGYAQKALALCRKNWERYQDDASFRLQAQVIYNIANILHMLRRYEEAIDQYEQALLLSKKIEGGDLDQAKCLSNVGGTFLKMGRLEEASSRAQEALTICNRIRGADYTMGVCFAVMGQALRRQGKLDDVIHRLYVAEELGRYVGISLAQTLEARKSGDDLNKAMRMLLSAKTRIEQYRDLQYGAEVRMAASSKAAPVYGYLARFLVDRGRENWESKEEELVQWATAKEAGARCLEAAFHFAEAGKARTLVELVQQRQMDVGQDPAGRKLLDEDRQLLAQIGKAHERRETAKQKDVQELIKQLDDQISQYQQRRQQIEYELKKTYVGKFTVPEFQKASEIQAELPEGVAVLQYVVTEDDSRLIVLTRNGISGFDIPIKAEVPWDIPSRYKGQWNVESLTALAGRFATDGPKVGLEGLVRLYRAPMDLADPNRPEATERTLPETMVTVGMALRDLLLPPEARKLLSDQKITHLVVIPDGPIHLIPFAALPMGAVKEGPPRTLSDCRFLIEEYTVSYLSSWSMREAIRSAAKERKVQGKQKELLALADPVYSKADPRVKEIPLGETKPLEIAAVLRSCYEKYGWNRLPETLEEAKTVGTGFGKLAVVADLSQVPAEEAVSVAYTGKAATPKALDQADQYRRILLATHGVADPRNAWLSCLALSPPPEQGYDSPAYLKATDIMGLKLNADLVTLSACETGLGRLQQGEGLVGLSSAFFIAGARSLALTLWKVPSGETAEISVKFHELLKTEPNKAQALREAQLAFLEKHPDRRHPFWWAAWILTGDWE